MMDWTDGVNIVCRNKRLWGFKSLVAFLVAPTGRRLRAVTWVGYDLGGDRRLQIPAFQVSASQEECNVNCWTS